LRERLSDALLSAGWEVWFIQLCILAAGAAHLLCILAAGAAHADLATPRRSTCPGHLRAARRRVVGRRRPDVLGQVGEAGRANEAGSGPEGRGHSALSCSPGVQTNLPEICRQIGDPKPVPSNLRSNVPSVACSTRRRSYNMKPMLCPGGSNTPIVTFKSCSAHFLSGFVRQNPPISLIVGQGLG